MATDKDKQTDDKQTGDKPVETPVEAPIDTPVQEGNADDKGNVGKQGDASGGTEESKPTIPPEEKAKETKKTKKIRFALADSQLMWSTPNKSIELSAFTQITGSEISSDDDDYDRVMRSIELGTLVELKENIKYPVFKTKELTYGKVKEEEAAKAQKHYNIKEYLNMLQDDVINKIKDIKDPKLLIRLIVAEKAGQNKDKASRQNVLSTLREKLKTLNINGVYDVELDDL